MFSPESETLVFEPTPVPQRPPDARLLHYNDVYHVDASSAEPVGGIARFQTLVNYYRRDPRFEGQPELVTVFSGDAFNPSLESSVTKGSHMVPVLNDIGTDVACLGNHDLDFGVAQFRTLASQCKFPWLLANVLDPALGKDVPLGNAKQTALLSSSGVKIGFVGLGEREWLATINALPPDLVYVSATQMTKSLVPGLRENGADLILAVSHQREPNDVKLAENVGSEMLDMVLGGHDHYYNHVVVNGVHVLRSGSDFKQLTYIEGWRMPEGEPRWQFRITRRDVFSSIPEDETALKEVDKLTLSLRAKLEKPIGYTLAPLDARFTTVRLRESNLGNLVCDLMRYYYNTDCCIMAGGTIRGDQIYGPGILQMKDIMNCFPFEDAVVVVRVTGSAILAALENGVSLYPALEGRFPQVSNIRFTFDPALPAGARVSRVSIAGAPLDPEKKYTLATRGYMARGRDGYTSLVPAPPPGGTAGEISEDEIVSEENGVLISAILRQFFLSLRVVDKWAATVAEDAGARRHWDAVRRGVAEAHGVVEPSPRGGALRRPPVQRVAQEARTVDGGSRSGYDSDVETDADGSSSAGAIADGEAQERRLAIARRVVRKWRRLAGLCEDAAACDALRAGEFAVPWTKAVAPRLEGRIRIVGQTAK